MEQVTKLKISKDRPPNYYQIISALGEDKDAVFCYGDTIYNPNGRDITPDVEVHELVHSKQQGDNPESWYNFYINDPKFRLKQEVEAYGTQYLFIKKYVKGKLLSFMKDKLAMALSSETYGNLVTYREAEKLIRTFKK